MVSPTVAADNQARLLDDGIIFVSYSGPQDYDSIMSISAGTERLAEQLRQAGRPVKLLTDVSRVTSQTVGARKAGLEIVRRVHFDAIVVCGGSKFIKYLAIFFLRATGHPKAQYFATRQEGLTWLRQQ